MPLPSSGQISFSDINTELGRASDDEMSLSDAEGGVYGAINTSSPSYPDGIAPNSISEWYDYDHNAGPALTEGIFYDTPNLPAGDSGTACSEPPDNPYQVWFSGTGTIGDFVYADDQGSSPFSGFSLWWKGDLSQPNIAIQLDNSGQIIDISIC